MEIFETRDINNNFCKFQYSFEYDKIIEPTEITFSVFSIPENFNRYFSYEFKIINHKLAKGYMMTNNNNEEFAKKGIPEKIIEIASLILKRDIISSPIKPKAGNYLVVPSYKAWLRLTIQSNNAYLDKNRDCFVLKFVKI